MMTAGLIVVCHFSPYKMGVVNFVYCYLQNLMIGDYSVIVVYSGKWQGRRNLFLSKLFCSCSKILGTVIVFTSGSHNSSESQQFWLWVPALPLGKSVSEFVFLPLSSGTNDTYLTGLLWGSQKYTEDLTAHVAGMK